MTYYNGSIRITNPATLQKWRQPMAREIIFRGKRTDNGEWAFGGYVQDKEWARHGIYQLELSGAFYQLVRHEVDPATVGQFTGLLDKNGNKVFEGDILIVPGGAWGVVVWKSPFFEVTISATESSLYSREWLQECEVFGNQWDNPELMKEATND